MIEKFWGDKYLFELEITPSGKRFGFHLFAIDRQSLHYSNINDLSTVLSRLDIEDEDPLVEDKCWTLSKSKMDQFRTIIRKSLTNKTSLRYLEARVDEDRREGEWTHQLQTES